MAWEGQDSFRRYLSSIPDELLEQVSEDCAWLAGTFAGEPPCAGYRARLALCREKRSHRPVRESGIPAWGASPTAAERA